MHQLCLVQKLQKTGLANGCSQIVSSFCARIPVSLNISVASVIFNQKVGFLGIGEVAIVWADFRKVIPPLP